MGFFLSLFVLDFRHFDFRAQLAPQTFMGRAKLMVFMNLIHVSWPGYRIGATDLIFPGLEVMSTTRSAKAIVSTRS